MGNRANAIVCWGVVVPEEMEYEEVEACLGPDSVIEQVGHLSWRALAWRESVQATDWDDPTVLDLKKFAIPPPEVRLALGRMMTALGIEDEPKWLLFAGFWLDPKLRYFTVDIGRGGVKMEVHDPLSPVDTALTVSLRAAWVFLLFGSALLVFSLFWSWWE